MRERIWFLLNRLQERLWVRPLVMTFLSILLVFLARTADITNVQGFVPEIAPGSIKTLLTIISASMLVISTFSVASMVSAYASASSTATPRAFSLVISDDVSQNALSAFIGAFIFSVVALIAIENSFYGKAGRFALFGLTIMFFAIVIVTFVRWVDSIARLGRLGNTIDKVEAATASAFDRSRCAPSMGCVTAGSISDRWQPIYGKSIGFLQRIDLAALQAYAEVAGIKLQVDALPGTFCTPNRVLLFVITDSNDLPAIDKHRITEAFSIDVRRTFDEDPRFGLTVLSEIASRALSPAVNDPGTAIDVIGRLIRLLVRWQEPCEEHDQALVEYDRVSAPELSLSDMFEDAFNAIARDGAGTIEVALWIQKAFASLAAIGDDSGRMIAKHQARLALARAERALDFPADLEAVRKSALFANASGSSTA